MRTQRVKRLDELYRDEKLASPPGFELYQGEKLAAPPGFELYQGEKLAVPPGFTSLTTFTLKRVEAEEDATAIESPCDMEISSESVRSIVDDDASIRSLKFQRRPSVVCDQLKCEGESDVKQLNMSMSTNIGLPKGVIRGCSECSDCQKVSARWNPRGACTYLLQDAPVFHPNHEEFKDTSKYIDSIRQQVEPYGMCRIVPPPSWKLPCFLEEDDIWQSYKVSTEIQRVNKLVNHRSFRKASADNDLRNTKRRKLDNEFSDGCAANFSSGEYHGIESFQFESGPTVTLIAFKRQADYFRQCYFSEDSEIAEGKTSPSMHLEQWEPSEQNIEGEYWRIIEKPTEEIEVLNGTGNFGCRSPVSADTEKDSDSPESSASGWNLNCISSLPGSLLSLDTLGSSSILVPQLHFGMCFSSVPWTVEEHRLFKLYSLHLGAPKIWYGISGNRAHEFEAFRRKHFSDPSEQTEGRQLSPGTLKSEGIPVYRCIQRPGEFVLFLPGCCYSGFDCGFNCSASAVFAPLDWLPHGLISTELYREQKRKTAMSYDKLLLRAAHESVKARWENLVRGTKTPMIVTWKEASGMDGILTKTLRARLRSEVRCREYLSSDIQSRKMEESFDAGGRKIECSTCFYDLFLSAVTCPCHPNKYSCLIHTKHLCSCSWADKIVLVRYQVSELNILREAVEGKISAIGIWMREDLGLPLQWDRLGQDKNELVVPSSVSGASNGRAISPAKDENFSEAKEPLCQGKSSDDFNAEAMESLREDSIDDTSSSSSSDFDIDACIAYLESRK